MTPDEIRRLYHQRQMNPVRNQQPNPQMNRPIAPRPSQNPYTTSTRIVNATPYTRTTGGCCGRRRSQG